MALDESVGQLGRIEVRHCCSLPWSGFEALANQVEHLSSYDPMFFTWVASIFRLSQLTFRNERLSGYAPDELQIFSITVHPEYLIQ